MLSATVRSTSILGDFLRWWRAELLALVPERVRQVSRPQGRLVVKFEGDAAANLGFETPTKFTALGQVDRLADEGAADRVRAILVEARRAFPALHEGWGVCLRLDPRSALIQTIELPLEAAGNLREVIGYELDRYTPFRAEQVYYGYRVLPRDKAAERLAVEVILVPKEAADEALARARELGLAVERLDVASRSGEGGSAGGLHVPAIGAENRSPNRRIRALTVAAVILLVIAFALPFVATQRKAAAMVEEAAALRARAQMSEGTRSELQAIRGEQDFLVERKARTPMVSDLLLEVTRLLPDDTWISEFQAGGAELTITGVTRSASGLIALFERSGVFQNTNFKSPVTTDPSDGLEKFSIAAQIVEKRRP